MMKKYVIVGNSVYASMLYEYLKAEELFSVIAFTVENEYICEPVFHGLPVVPYERIQEVYLPDTVDLLLGVGYSHMNEIKERVFLLYKQKGYSFATYAHASAIIPTEIELGEGNIFFEGTIIQKGCKIGDGNVFFARTLVAHDCIIGDYNSFSAASIAGNVEIKNKCFVGMGSVISENLVLEDQSFVGANAYVNDHMQKGWAALGAKGKMVQRDISNRII